MFLSRASGILLHPTSFPGRFGIGDLGGEAYRFIDFLNNSDQQWWQVLPLGPTGYGNSPYLAYSALAGNPLLISPEKLLEEGLINEEDWSHLPDFPLDYVDYDLVRQTKMPLFKKASEKFKTHSRREEFDHFCHSHAYWLDDYALFMAVKEVTDNASWNKWDEGISKRKPEAIAEWTNRLEEEIFYHKFMQFEFYRQWKELKKYANERGIKIFGDVPIYVAHDSADVWAHPEIFCLDEATGEASLMAGVPPDYFSATGQLWGNPVYNWDRLKETNFQWWVQRIEGMLDYVDVFRIDHFRGFQAYWAVPQGEPTAVNGQWVEAPGEAFFQLVADKLGKLPIVAEDLGTITSEVEALRDKFEFPGMKILQFAFDSDRANPYLPYNYTPNSVVYTGTHDNDTTLGWFNGRSPEEKIRVTDYLGSANSKDIHWSLIRLALGSVSLQAVFPLQDILGLGSEAKMNTPSQPEGNWSWRYAPGALNPSLGERLKQLTYLYGRAPNRS